MDATIVGLGVRSPVFRNGDDIPIRYTCDGEDVSPALEWGPVPDGAGSIAIICDDLDSPHGRFVHWGMFNLPASVRSLPEDVPAEERLQNGAQQTVNDFGRIGYGGPCPGHGKHRYVFHVYALNVKLNLDSRPTAAELRAAMSGHVLGEGELMGRYQRQ